MGAVWTLTTGCGGMGEGAALGKSPDPSAGATFAIASRSAAILSGERAPGGFAAAVGASGIASTTEAVEGAGLNTALEVRGSRTDYRA